MRSSLLMSRDNTALLVVDVQEKLVPAIEQHEKIVWNIGRLVDAAKLLGLPVRLTEQYPRGLGHTVPEIRNRVSEAAEKSMFSCRECAELFESLQQAGINNILVSGIEAHVCVAQTALDLLTNGFNVFLAVDAIGSRFDVDYQTSLRRMEVSGGILTSTEAAIFEWCETSKASEFKAISALIREEAPG